MLQTPEIPTEQITDELEKGKEAWQSLKGLSIDDAITKIANSMVDFAFKLMIAILIFYIGRFIIRKIYKMTLNVMTRRKMDPSLTTFVLSLVKMVLYFILIITIIGILGIETSSFLAIFASAGVAMGMALSGTLQNFAGGVLILLLKPYKVGDYIEAQGYAGTVKSIQLFSTVINTIDNKAIIIPNGGLSTSSINNYSLENYRRVDWNISLSYDTDYDKAEKAIMDIILSDDRVVRKYIEDDMEIRREIEEMKCRETPELCNDAEGDSNDEEVKKHWYSALVPHLRKKKKAIRRSLSEDIEMNASIPRKIERAPFVGLSEMGDSAIVITVRAWTQSSFYWPLFFDLNRRFFTELPQQGFLFPFPQLDVHLNQVGEATNA